MHMLPVSGQGAAVQRGREVSRYRITTAAATVALALTTNTGHPLLVEWGDGATSVCASGFQVSHAYAAPYTGFVTVSAFSQAVKTTRWSSASNGWSFALAALPKSVETLMISGDNTVTGNLSDIRSATSVEIRGNSVIGGDLKFLRDATYIWVAGSNTVYGDLSVLNSPNYVTLQGANTITYSGSSWPTTTMRQVYVRGASSIATADIDALLIALAATVTTWTNERTVNLKGARTSASDAAYSTLQGRGVAVTVN